MYAKFGIMHLDPELFEKMKDKTTILWNIMIVRYVQIKLLKEVENIFQASATQRHSLIECNDYKKCTKHAWFGGS